jgi:hypothetical protein
LCSKLSCVDFPEPSIPSTTKSFPGSSCSPRFFTADAAALIAAPVSNPPFAMPGEIPIRVLPREAIRVASQKKNPICRCAGL